MIMVQREDAERVARRMGECGWQLFGCLVGNRFVELGFYWGRYPMPMVAPALNAEFVKDLLEERVALPPGLALD